MFTRILLRGSLVSGFVKSIRGSLFSPSDVQPNKIISKMRVIHVPALSDNYMYLLVDEKSNICAAIDPVEPKKLLQKVQEQNLHLVAVLTTHHHWDHAGGNKELASLIPGITIYGGDDRIDCLTKKVSHNDVFSLGSLQVRCLFTPCHTSGHFCYFVTDETSSEDPIVFTGDTMFVGGCGRFFEGNAEQMYHALVKVLGSLPPQTLVYCGHEYTCQNLMFASIVEPSNEFVKKKLCWAQDRTNSGYPTIPSTIADEFQTNPFMRVDESSVQCFAGTSNPILAMKIIRQKKDSFRG